MKYFIAILFAFNAYAFSCKVQESEGSWETGDTKMDAMKAAWMACAERKMDLRDSARLISSEEEYLMDVTSCENAEIKCTEKP